MTKVKTTCEGKDCNKILRKADTYITYPGNKKLCEDCFQKWLWEDEPKSI